MIKYIFSALVGYLVGSLSPAALISKIKHKDLRRIGTHNLGATNVTLTVGKGWGIVVMVFDVGKAYLLYKFFEIAFPDIAYIGLVAAGATVVGHVFPFYLGFRGGKGLACFGGLVLAYDVGLFLFMLAVSVVLMLLVNHAFVVPFYGGIAFFLAVVLREHEAFAVVVTFFVSLLLLLKNSSNMVLAIKGKDIKIRDYITGRQ